MNTKLEGAACTGTRFSISDGDKEIAHAYLYVLENDAHEAPFALIEDVHVDVAHRHDGVGSRLVEQLVDLAAVSGCYKVVLTSRDGREPIHDWYARLGFTRHGRSFRMDLHE